MQLKKILGYIYIYGVIFGGGTIFLIQWHTGLFTPLYEAWRGPIKKTTVEVDPDALPANAEIDPAEQILRWEKLSRKGKWQFIIDETERRQDNIALAYRTLAILESGDSLLLLEGMQNLRELMKVNDLPNDLSARLAGSLGDPEAPGPTARENLEAYKEIIDSLHIATQPSSLKKLRELEALAAEEAAGK